MTAQSIPVTTDVITHVTAESGEKQTNHRVLPRLGAIGVGVGIAAIGLLPQLISGMRLPLQSLWANHKQYDNMPYLGLCSGRLLAR